jgi:hypothetical protein
MHRFFQTWFCMLEEPLKEKFIHQKSLLIQSLFKSLSIAYIIHEQELAVMSKT